MKRLIFLGIIASIYILLIFTGCPDPGNGTPTPKPTPTLGPPVILITGVVHQDEYTTYAEVTIFDSNNELVISDATVKVNGTNCSYTDNGSNYYEVIDPITAGANVTFVITGTGFSITQTLTMPKAVSLTAPGSGSTCNAANNINVTWSAIDPDPGYIYIYVDGIYTDSGMDYTAELQGSALSHSIPARTLAAGHTDDEDEISLDVTTINTLSLSGTDIDPMSYLDVEHTIYRDFKTY